MSAPDIEAALKTMRRGPRWQSIEFDTALVLIKQRLEALERVAETARRVGHETENGEHTYPAWIAPCPLCDALAALDEALK